MLTGFRLIGLALLVLSALAVAALSAHADEGRIVIKGPAPITISEPGHYVVGQDILAPECCGITILIDSSRVTLDLNGFTVFGLQKAIEITGGSTDITIRNGRTYGEEGVFYGHGLPGIRLRVEGIHYVTPGKGGGIRVFSAKVVDVLDCTFVGDDAPAIQIEAAGTGTFRGRIRNNFVDGEEGGMFLSGLETGEVSHNTVISQSDHAIWIVGPGGGNLIEANLVEPHRDAIRVESDNNLIRNNTVTVGFGSGIDVTGSGNRLVGNVIKAGFTGIKIGGAFNLLEGNVAGVPPSSAGNHCAIVFQNGAEHVYRNNMLRSGDKIICGPANMDGGGNLKFKFSSATTTGPLRSTIGADR